MPSTPALNEALDFVSQTTLPGVLWGINLSFYFLCTQLSYQRWRKAPDELNKHIFSLICNSVMVLMAGLELGTDSRLIQLGFVNHGGVDGEPLEFIDSMKNSSNLLSLNNVPFIFIPVLNSLVQLCRIWVIWGTSPYKFAVTIVPLLLQIVSQTVNIYSLTAPVSSLEEEELLATSSIAVGLAFNLLVTFLLVGRIIFWQRRNNHLMGTTPENSTQYTNIIAILVESYALDSIWETAAVITFTLSSEGILVRVFDLFNDTGDQVTVFALLLVSYRVLSNRAWTPQTGRQLSTLRWNHDDPEATGTTGLTTAPDHLSPDVTR